MTSDVRQTIDDIFHVACELPFEERSIYLEKACAGNATLRHEIEDLLKHHETVDTFLEKPAIHDAARNLARDLTLSDSNSQPRDDTMQGLDWIIGQYRILGQIGKGGMGVVYLADDTQSGKQVAIKVLPFDLRQDVDRLARFNREARMLEELKHLKHPNIAEFYEQIEYQGAPCLVLEYVPGDTLADRLKDGPLPVKESLRIALQIADAFVSAHRQHIVHRDLKPANIKITPEGEVKMLDFGLAKRFRPDLMDKEAGDFRTDSHSLTESGVLIGTPAYMSPEQWDGKEIDQRVDIWAYGCVLYEMLTGRQPFARNTRSETMKAVLKDDPDWSDLPAETPLVVQDLIRQCLQKDPNKRLQDINDAKNAIIKAIGKNIFALKLFVKSQVWRARRHATAIAATAGILIIAAIAFWYWKNISAIPDQKYIVVLPFKGFEKQEAGVGFAKELRSNLLNISNNLLLVQPSDSLQTNLLGIDFQHLLSQSGANLIVDGEIRRSGDRITIDYSVQNSHKYKVSTGRVEGLALALGELHYRIARQIADDLSLTTSSRAGDFSKHLKFNQGDSTEQYLIAIGELQKDLNKESVEKPIKILEDLIRSDGDSARFQAALAQAYLNKYVFTAKPELAQKALQACESAKGLAPGQPEIYQVSCGLVYDHFGRHQEAINEFLAALERHPSDWEALRGLALAYSSSGKVEEAEKTYSQAIGVWPNFWSGYNELGRLYYVQGKYDKAIENWQRVVSLLPDSPTGYNNLAAAYLQTDQEGNSIRHYDISISKDRTRDNIEAYTGLGTVFFYRGEYDKALKYFQEGIELVRAAGMQEPVLLGNLGDTYRRMASLQSVPNLVDEYNRRAAEAYDQAINISEQGAVGEIEDAEPLGRTANWLAKRLKTDDAIKFINRAINLDSTNVEVAYNAVVVYMLAGDRTQTLKWLEKAACSGYSPSLLGRDPELQQLRFDSQYQQIITKCRQQSR